MHPISKIRVELYEVVLREVDEIEVPQLCKTKDSDLNLIRSSVVASSVPFDALVRGEYFDRDKHVI